VFAWKVLRGGLGGVAVQESRADGVVTKAQLSGPVGGLVQDMRMAGSGVGDAALAFLQGGGAGTQIAAGIVDAPPQQFAVATPLDYTRAKKIAIGWDDAVHAIGDVRYAVAVDDEEVRSGLREPQTTLGPDDVDDGVHTIVVTATDTAGQETESTPAQVKVDRTKPQARVRSAGRAVTIAISDGAKDASSGVLASATTVAFGDGKHLKGRRTKLRHRYSRAGSFRVVVVTRDRAGNRTTVRKVVRVR